MRARGLHLLFFSVPIGAVVWCGGTSSTSVAPPSLDGSTPDSGCSTASEFFLVPATCNTPNATCTGLASTCTDITMSTNVTCTCHDGLWDCAKCADCNVDLRVTPPATPCTVCMGGSVTRCDGTRVSVRSCYLGCGHGTTGWNCTEFDGGIGKLKSCPSDAGPD